MTAAPRIDGYDWAGGREAMLRFGPDHGPVAVLTLPLFEEANRTRAFGVAILRGLAVRGIAGVLPDVPGQGESLMPSASVTLATMQEAYRGLVDQLRQGDRRCYAVGIRSGTLLDADSPVAGRWWLALQEGPMLLRELMRLRHAAAVSGRPVADADGDWVEIAGNIVATALLAELSVNRGSPGGPIRTVRLASDSAPADRIVEASPLWRRSEPGNDPAIADLLADDIASWITRCEG